MTSEGFERRMEFTLERRAQFASGIQQLQEVPARTERNITRTEQVVSRIADVTLETPTTSLEGFRDAHARIEALTEAQSRTDESLRRLSDTLDRHLREGRNGGSQADT